MLKKIITFLLMVSIAISLGIFSGCQTTLSLEETEKTEVTQVIKTEDNERKRDQEEFIVFCWELNALIEKYSGDLDTLMNKSIDTEDSNRKLAYEELIFLFFF